MSGNPIQRLVITCVWLSALYGFSVAADEEESPPRIADLGTCALTSGVALKPCRIAYRHYGPELGSGHPVMVFPTWYTGATGDLEAGGYIGPGMMADTTKFTVLVVGALGNGESESPSNHPPGLAFPEITIADMVSSQHQLLTQEFKLGQIHTVLGVSLGGMQALEWGVRYPHFMKHVVAIEGTPWPSAWDRLSWGAMISAMEAYDGTQASRLRTSRQLSRLEAWVLWTPVWFHSMVPDDGLETFLKEFDPKLTSGGIFNRQSQLTAALNHDVGRVVGGDRKAAAAVLQARTLIMVFDQDHYVHPGPSKEFAELAGTTFWSDATDCGHMGPTTECEQAEIARVVNEFLAEQ